MPRQALKTMFKKTEPQQPTAAEPSNIPTPIPGMETYVSESEPEKKKLKPQSVYLTKSELAYVQEIADAYGESRHSVMQYAVKELIRDWKRGKKPRTNILGKLDK